MMKRTKFYERFLAERMLLCVLIRHIGATGSMALNADIISA
ncbi:hypothetical protein ACG74X_01410 [Marivita sp. S0852]